MGKKGCYWSIYCLSKHNHIVLQSSNFSLIISCILIRHHEQVKAHCYASSGMCLSAQGEGVHTLERKPKHTLALFPEWSDRIERQILSALPHPPVFSSNRAHRESRQREAEFITILTWQIRSCHLQIHRRQNQRRWVPALFHNTMSRPTFR